MASVTGPRAPSQRWMTVAGLASCQGRQAMSERRHNGGYAGQRADGAQSNRGPSTSVLGIRVRLALPVHNLPRGTEPKTSERGRTRADESKDEPTKAPVASPRPSPRGGVGDAASPDPAAAGPATPSADRSADGRPNPRADVADRVERPADSDQQHRAWHRQRATAILDVTNHINVEQQCNVLTTVLPS